MTDVAKPLPSSKALFAVGFVLLEATIGVAVNNISSLRNAVVTMLIIAVVAVATYVRALEGDPDDAPGWWTWASARRWPGFLFVTASVMLLAGTSVWVITQPGPVECSFASGGAGVISATPRRVSHGMTFCPIRANGGLPIRGPFQVEGSIVGTRSARQNLLLAVTIDPYTCAANGKPGAHGTFPVPQVDLGTDEGNWSYVDDLGNYPEGVTLGRIFEYLSGPTPALESLRAVPGNWIRRHGDAPGYSGVAKLPPGVEILASFYVPGGQYNGRTAPCKAL